MKNYKSLIVLLLLVLSACGPKAQLRGTITNKQFTPAMDIHLDGRYVYACGNNMQTGQYSCNYVYVWPSTEHIDAVYILTVSVDGCDYVTSKEVEKEEYYSKEIGDKTILQVMTQQVPEGCPYESYN